MALIVQKYGGTSVGDTEKIRRVVRRVIETKKQGNDMVVVLSAMAGETNKLISLAHQITEDPDPRELDVLVSTGEQITIALFAIAAKTMGNDARSFLGHQVRILTDNAYGKARIADVDTSPIRENLRQGCIVVIAGFQGIDADGNITTLGRGGSDTTAVALAAALDADLCEIFTDVEGVFTTDPNVCSDARKIDRISYDELLEMASLGAKVMEIRSVEFAKRYNVPLHIRSSFNNNPGTMVVQEEKEMEDRVVTGVTYNKSEARITLTKVPDKPGIAAKIFTHISDANIAVDMIIQNTRASDLTDLTFTVPRADFKKAMEIVQRLGKEIGCERVMGDENIAKVSLIGMGMRNHVGIAGKMFGTLAAHNINIMMISTSEIKISAIIDEKYTELAVRVLHDAFELGDTKNILETT
ncbi:MAG: aspartate kinase [Thermodesulfobacteriota bacterium]|nr:aspartate kinase [Thermodesulfobacteriota bacterium]